MSRKVKVAVTFKSTASTREINDTLNKLAVQLTSITENNAIDWTIKRARG